MESNAGEKVWKAISMLGLVTKDKAKDYRKKIAEMESSNKKRREMAKTNKSRLI